VADLGTQQGEYKSQSRILRRGRRMGKILELKKLLILAGEKIID
jgi:hypothetical protein